MSVCMIGCETEGRRQGRLDLSVSSGDGDVCLGWMRCVLSCHRVNVHRVITRDNDSPSRIAQGYTKTQAIENDMKRKILG